MKVFWAINDAGGAMENGALAIGNFDGVHCGHQALLTKARSLACAGPVGVLSFSPHPACLLKKNLDHFQLTTDEEKLRHLKRLGVDVAILHKIDEAFLALSPDAFVRDMLVTQLRMRHVVVGDDFSFGNKAQGTTAMLSSWGEAWGFSTAVVPAVLMGGHRCSSSAIRTYLRSGRLDQARAMLGRYFSLAGTVVPGQKLGRMLGFRTANLVPPKGFDLAHGIYATMTRVYRGQGFSDFLSATNVGVRPTIAHDNHLLVETHLLDQEIDLYGLEIRIFFVEYLRCEEKFLSLDELRKQIAQDCNQTRQLESVNPTRFHVTD